MSESSEKIKCELCNEQVHIIQLHLAKKHPEMTIDKYKELYPKAQLLSEKAQEELEKRQENSSKKPIASEVEETKEVNPQSEKTPDGKGFLHEVFSLKAPEAKNQKGNGIPITVFDDVKDFKELIPEVKNSYVHDAKTLKQVMLGIELNLNVYVWGHKGCGKSEMFEQICARTNRPLMRVQHTANTEESHIVGMWTVKDGATVFELGPLALAMKHGWLYLADEYDFAMPSVLSVYQAVLEGKPLIIKEADLENRSIKPHPNFRFVATGNTNGSGDETGLYQGTNLQNSANYDRFGVVLFKDYMPNKEETEILVKTCRCTKSDAISMVKFATLVRDAYASGKLSDVVSTRSIINATTIGMKLGSFLDGVNLSFANKLSTSDREVVDGFSKRIFGE